MRFNLLFFPVVLGRECAFSFSLRTLHLVLNSKVCSFAPAPIFSMRNDYSSLDCFSIFLKKLLDVFLWVYFYILFLLHWSMCLILWPIPHCINYCSYIISLTIGKSDYFHFIFFQVVLAILALVTLHITFGTSLSISTRKSDGTMTEIIWKS